MGEHPAGTELAKGMGAVLPGREPDAGHGFLDNRPQGARQILDRFAHMLGVGEQRMVAGQPGTAGREQSVIVPQPAQQQPHRTAAPAGLHDIPILVIRLRLGPVRELAMDAQDEL